MEAAVIVAIVLGAIGVGISILKASINITSRLTMVETKVDSFGDRLDEVKDELAERRAELNIIERMQEEAPGWKGGDQKEMHAED